MSELNFYILVGLGVIVALLQLVLLFRRQAFETPADLNARVGLLEQGVQGVVQATAKSQSGTERIEQHLQAFTQATTAGFDASKRSLDDQLERTVNEARNGRAELLIAFVTFETRLEQRFTTVEGTLTGRLIELQKQTVENLESSRKALDEKLGQTLEEARSGRAELATAFGAFERKLDQRIAGLDTSLNTRFDALQLALTGRLEEAGRSLLSHLTQAQTNAANGRNEMTQTLATFRGEMSQALGTLSAESVKAREALAENATTFETRIQERFEALTTVTGQTLGSLKNDISSQLGVMSIALKEQLELNGNQIRNQFTTLQDSVAQQLLGMAQGSQRSSEELRTALNERLAAIQQDNTAKLEEMRRTVDEKLHATLEQRLGDSFKLVSERLEQVHAGLGEMKTLAGSVGDLKRVMTNVRSRGTWGEVQLGAIIESLLTAEQYSRNVKTVRGSDALVEFAVRMPGKTDDSPVWLPMDSKYPVELYQRLLDAHELADKAVIQQAATAFETSIRIEAKKISSKYLSPPETTDFAIMFLPTEGLFAEVARIPGLIEILQNEHRVVIAGPTTLAAMLNSLRLGFRTLAIEKRSSEVWGILATVKTEFRKFGEVVDATKKSIDAAARKFDDVGVRSRAIERSLREIHDLPSPVSVPALDVTELLPLEAAAVRIEDVPTIR